jgi:hypothetical protein
MKKAFVILLLLVYGASASGMTLHLHYCCGKLEKIDFSSPDPKHCKGGKENRMASRPCCDSKEISIKITGEQNPGKIFQASFQTAAIKIDAVRFLILPPPGDREVSSQVFVPPPLQKNLNKLYCIYRI